MSPALLPSALADGQKNRKQYPGFSHMNTLKFYHTIEKKCG